MTQHCVVIIAWLNSFVFEGGLCHAASSGGRIERNARHNRMSYVIFIADPTISGT
jgi:hypothetical protein